MFIITGHYLVIHSVINVGNLTRPFDPLHSAIK